MNPDTPAIDAFNRAEQQRLECQPRLFHRLRKRRRQRHLLRSGIQNIDAGVRQLIAFDNGIFLTDEVVKGFKLLRGGRVASCKDIAVLIAKLDQRIDFGAPIFSVGQQRNHIAAAAGKGISDFADGFDDVGLVEFAAAFLAVFEVNILIFDAGGL